MKRCVRLFTSLAGILIFAVNASAQTSADAGESDLPCSFTVDGKPFTGKTTIQEFPSTKEYSILCEDTSTGWSLIQLVFHDESSARVEQKLDIVTDKATSAEGKNQVSAAYNNTFVTGDDSAGSVTVAKSGQRSIVELDSVKVRDLTKSEKTISGKITF